MKILNTVVPLIFIYFSTLCVREELAIVTKDGSLTRVRWNGTVNTKLSFKFSDVAVATDFQQSRCKQYCMSHVMINLLFAYAKTKAQISGQLIAPLFSFHR